MKLKKILILGSSGKLGYELFKKLNKFFKVYHNGLQKRKLDISKIYNLEKIILKNKPDIIINASGYTNIDLCELNKKKCLEINTNLVGNIFKIKKNHDLKFNMIQFSTDQLYDGSLIDQKEDQNVKINNYYSKTKFLSEKIALKNKATIFRINFFSLKKRGNSSIHKFIKKAKNDKICNLFGDVYFNPLRVKTISEILYILIRKNLLKQGLFNLGSKNGVSKSEFYIFIFKLLKENLSYNVVKVNTYLNTKRSKNMLMSTKKFEKKFHIKLPNLKSEIIKEVKEFYE